MILALLRSDYFLGDFELQFRWYLAQAGDAVADRYVDAVEKTLQELTAQPGLGRRRAFRHDELQGLYSFRVRPPFDAHLIFYRYSNTGLSAERVMHGRRDLPRRLRQPPGGA